MEASKKCGKQISRHTVRRRVREKGIKSYVAARKPLLTLKNRIARKQWCKRRLFWQNYWRKGLFSDEAPFALISSKYRVFVHRTKDEKCKAECLEPKVQAGGGKLQIWGCMSAEGVGEMRVIEGTMKNDNYVNVL